VGRLRIIGLLAAVAACAALCAPASASAGTYSWSQPADFTDIGTGSSYGPPSWSYSASGATLQHSGSFNGGTLAGWTDNPSMPTSWIAVPAGGTASTLQMVPAKGKSVALTWRSPFSTAQTVTVSGSVSEPGQGLLCNGTTWSLYNGATPVTGASGSGGASISPSGPVTVAAGAPLALIVTDASAVLRPYSTSCDETDVTLSLAVSATPPPVTLTSPANGSTVSGGLPTFAGAAGNAFGDNSQVTVRVYSGSSTGGAPVQTLTTTASGGGYSIAETSALADGAYTAQAEQDDVASPVDAGLSSAVTFTLANGPPPIVTLKPPSSQVLATGTPTFTGTAGKAAGDSAVELAIYSGSSPSGAPLRDISGSVNSSGGFSIQVEPALPNGDYTAVAGQAGPGGAVGVSSAVTFSVSVVFTPSSLALTQPAAGGSVAQSNVLFTGTAGNAPGDSNTITVALYKGSSTSGQSLGTLNIPANGSTWSGTWPKTLALGFYTAQASQVDGSGQTNLTPPHTFLIVPGSGVIGTTIRLAKSRIASIPITCLAPSGTVCRGTVLVITAHTFQPTAGGPKGVVRVMFAYVIVPGGQTVIVKRSLSRAVYRALRRKAPVTVRVITSLSKSGATAVTFTGTRTLRLR
jgi:hypothetical protein